MVNIRIWICAAYHPVYRCGGWASVRAGQGPVWGAAGGERHTTASRTALSGLVASLRDLPAIGDQTPAGAIDVQTTCPELAGFAALLANLDAPTQAAAPEEDLDLWAQIASAAKGRRLSLARVPLDPATPIAFAAAWADLARDKAKAAGAFTAAIPKPNLAKVPGLASRMIRWVQLGVARVPGDGGELRLMQRGGEFSIMAGAIELMGSRLSGSEEALANLTCARVRERPSPHVLIGGLGMGFTLRAALAGLGAGAAVTVAELVPEVIAWAQGPLASVHGDSLADPRVTMFEGDVAALIVGVEARYDAILLDVDNGPEGLMRKSNDDLYDAYGLTEAHAALRPGGVLAVWSSSPHPAFTLRLRAVGYGVEELRVWAKGRPGGARHVIWLATKGPT